MKTLNELLCERSGKDLFLMVLDKHLSLPGRWTNTEITEVRLTYYSDTQNEEYYLRFLRDWETGESEPIREDPEDAESAVSAKLYKEWCDSRLQLGRKLRSINESKKDYADILAKEMLKLESVQSMLLDLRDPCMQTIRDICNHTIQKENDFYPLSCDPDRNWQYLPLETHGYALIRKTDPYDEPDDRTHYTGICITDDVLAVIRKADTPELEAKRSLRRILDSLQQIVQDYYYAAPIGTVHQVYSVLREENSDRYPDFSEEELDRAILEYARDHDTVYSMMTFRGERYMYNTSDEISDDTDEDDEEAMFLLDIIERWKQREVEPYIPSLAEMQNYLQYGYWEAKKPFRDLRQFVVECYMDEQAMEGMGSGFLMMGMDPEERDAYLRDHHYSMDRVLENANEKFAFILLAFSGGNEPEDIYEGQKDFTCWLSDSSKRKFKRILKKCYECVPLPWRLGNTIDHQP